MKRGLVILYLFLFVIFTASYVSAVKIGEKVDPLFFVIPNGDGGGIIVYKETILQKPNTVTDFYSRLLNSDGKLSDPIYLTRLEWQPEPTTMAQVVPDGKGGAIILFIKGSSIDDKVLSVNFLNPNGHLRFESPIFVSSKGYQYNDLVPDGEGGAYILWSNAEEGNRMNVYFNHIAIDGSLKFSEDRLIGVQGAWPKSLISENGGYIATLLYNPIHFTTSMNFFDEDFNLLYSAPLSSFDPGNHIFSRTTLLSDQGGYLYIFWSDQNGFYVNLVDINGEVILDKKRILPERSTFDPITGMQVPFYSITHDLLDKKDRFLLTYPCNVPNCNLQGIYGGFYSLDDLFLENVDESFKPILLMISEEDSIVKTAHILDGEGNAFVFAVDIKRNFYQKFLTSDGKVYDSPLEKIQFIRGDVDKNNRVVITDAVFILDWLFRGKENPKCEDSADLNDDGKVDLTDSVFLLNHLFRGGAAPNSPYPEAGEDPTQDELTCQN